MRQITARLCCSFLLCFAALLLGACGSGDSASVITDTGQNAGPDTDTDGDGGDGGSGNSGGSDNEGGDNTDNGSGAEPDNNNGGESGSGEESGSGGEGTDESTNPDDNNGTGEGEETDSGNSGGENTDNNTDDNSGSDNTASLQPNIILVITDDQGLDASAQFNLSNDLPYTPVIDSLAASGITYENAWATPSCTTTRAALLSGKHGANNGVPSTPGILAPEVGTIQQHLQQIAPDYKTAVFGKWHVAGGNPDPDHPSQLGVQHYSGNLTGNLTDYFDWTVTTNGVATQSSQYHTSALVDYAIDWIAEQNTPWFTWLAFSAPHSPWHTPPQAFNRRELSGTAEDIEANTRDYYLSAIETLDTELGRLLNSLDAEVRDNTIVMVIGDNGTPRPVIDRSAYIGSHGKGSLFEGGIHVPLVISGYGVSRTNVREPGLVSIVDFFPTISALAGQSSDTMHDGYNLLPSFSSANAISRELLYTDYVSDSALGSGWTVRSDSHKYIAYTDGSEALYDLVADPDEASNLMPVSGSLLTVVDTLRTFGLEVRGETETVSTSLDITDSTLNNNSPNCTDHVLSYFATATNASTGTSHEGSLNVSVNDTHCVFSSNATPNHTFNDGSDPFPNSFSTQSIEYRVPLNPVLAGSTTALSLRYDDAILLNGVKIDLLAAGCFGVGDGKVGCNDDAQPWRYDPMFAANGFRVDTHNAHTQPNGLYHYHGDPNALFDRSGNLASPVIGFAADGFPIFGSYVEFNGVVREVQSSYQLKSGTRPSDNNQPGGTYDGAYRDDYEYVAGSGDLDECNGMMVDGDYAYYITGGYPYVVGCFKGSVDESFSK